MAKPFTTAEFMLGVADLSQLPKAIVPEVALIGRSNVGKSTLLNALTNRKTLARASNTPGRTQQLNFFKIDGRLFLVDMPGYGFAKAPLHEVKAWNALVRNYLRGRPNLKRVLVLIDARRGLMDVDEEMLSLLDDAAVSYALVLTKMDKVKAKEAEVVMAATAAAAKKFAACYPQTFATSAETGDGVRELQDFIASKEHA